MSASKLFFPALFGCFALAVVPARADVSLTFAFTSDHCSNPVTGGPGGCSTGAANMGTITVSQTAAQALSGQVAVSVLLEDGFGFISSGAGGGTHNSPSPSFFFRLLGDPTITYSGLTAGWSVPGGLAPQQVAGSYAGDGLAGQFEYAVSCDPPGPSTGCSFGGSQPNMSPLNFIVQAAGLTPAAFNDTGNPSGSPFAADVLSATGNTGLIDASLSSVPEPTSIMLFGGVMVLLARAFRKRPA